MNGVILNQSIYISQWINNNTQGHSKKYQWNAKHLKFFTCSLNTFTYSSMYSFFKVQNLWRTNNKHYKHKLHFDKQKMKKYIIFSDLCKQSKKLLVWSLLSTAIDDHDTKLRLQKMKQNATINKIIIGQGWVCNDMKNNNRNTCIYITLEVIFKDNSYTGWISSIFVTNYQSKTHKHN